MPGKSGKATSMLRDTVPPAAKEGVSLWNVPRATSPPSAEINASLSLHPPEEAVPPILFTCQATLKVSPGMTDAGETAMADTVKSGPCRTLNVPPDDAVATFFPSASLSTTPDSSKG